MNSGNYLHRFTSAALLISGAVVAYALYQVFAVVPNEQVMGPVQRIFYFHVAAAVSVYLAVAALFGGSLWFLASRSATADALAEAAGEIAFLFSSIVLATGMIWGRVAWNTWFSWREPRLVSFLLIWCILLGLVMLRRFAQPAAVAAHSAVLGIIASVMTPVTMYAIKLLPQMAQLHPKDVPVQGLHPAFREALGISIIGVLLFAVSLLMLRTQLGMLQRKVELEDRAR